MNKLPVVKRARDYYLYDLKGKRYLDMYQDNGRAVLGHRPEKISEVLKNTVSKGLIARYPSVYLSRLIKTLRSFFPDNGNILISSSEERAAKLLGPDSKPADIVMGRTGKAVLWRPYTDTPIVGDMLFPLLPVPGLFDLQIACLNPVRYGDLPESDIISPVLAAAVVRILYNLSRNKPENDTVFLRTIDEGSLFSRDGIYLRPLCSAEKYDNLYREALAKGIVLSPDLKFPSILPGILTDNEKKTIIEIVKG